MDDIQDKIKSALVNELFVEVPEDRMGLDDSLRNVFGLDSLGFEELRVQCEDMFGVRIPDKDFNPGSFASIRTLADLVRDLRAARSESV